MKKKPKWPEGIKIIRHKDGMITFDYSDCPITHWSSRGGYFYIFDAPSEDIARVWFKDSTDPQYLYAPKGHDREHHFAVPIKRIDAMPINKLIRPSKK